MKPSIMADTIGTNKVNCPFNGGVLCLGVFNVIIKYLVVTKKCP